MKKECLACDKPSESPKLVLWVALSLNFFMFLVELITSFMAESMSLRADSIDFLGDSVNYGVSIFILSMSLKTKAKASILKSASMAIFGLWVVFSSIYFVVNDLFPQPHTMGLMGAIAFVVNLTVAFLLFRFRNGDSNMQSVWLCTRNDVIGNLAVIIAASGVFISTTKWPDLIVAISMGLLALHSSYFIFISAKKELNT